MSQARNIQRKYEVEVLEGEVDRVLTMIEDGQFVQKTVKEPAGFMVYFPSGASMRARSLEHLQELGIDLNSVGLVDMETGEDVPVPTAPSLKSQVNAKTRSKGKAATA